MTNLKFTDYFTLGTAAAVIFLSIYLLGKMVQGGSPSSGEFELLSLLMIINAVNVIHNTK